jgi:hypothetical protein
VHCIWLMCATPMATNSARFTGRSRIPESSPLLQLRAASRSTPIYGCRTLIHKCGIGLRPLPRRHQGRAGALPRTPARDLYRCRLLSTRTVLVATDRRMTRSRAASRHGRQPAISPASLPGRSGRCCGSVRRAGCCV